MNTNAAVLNARALVCIAAMAACAALACPIRAKDQQVTIKIPVSYADLDLSRPSGAQVLYRRLQRAADIACTHGNRVGLEPVTDPKACYEKAIGDAVRLAKQPQLTMIYLKTHTPQDAATHGIEIQALVAAK